jgi:MFS family permease
VTVYLIVATIATPAMGRLADLHGRRRMLLACRTVQGIGGRFTR